MRGATLIEPVSKQVISRILALAALAAGPAGADDGAQLYTTYCSACHALDGTGATEGTFPPLAESGWMAGDEKRAIKIVLNGLHGPVDVNDRTYNLEMPPQGVVMSDAQIAAVLTYVRASWGNQDREVTAETVAAVRAESKDRVEMWTAEELLELHPLPAAPPMIQNLISRVYFGQWDKLPDFDRLMPESIEEEHDGVLSLRRMPREDSYGVVWEGQVEVVKPGTYRFQLDADDGCRVIIGGRTIVTVDGIGPMDGSRAKRARVPLKAGLHPIRVEYFENAGQQSLAFAWSPPGEKRWRWFTDDHTAGGPDRSPIRVDPEADFTVQYRNFIDGTTPRAIGFGFPNGVNLAYSGDHFGPELLWTGDFMDGSRHWIERGQGNQPPAGEEVVKINGSRAVADPAARFGGYRLDPKGNPTFLVRIGTQVLSDQWLPSGSETPGFLRVLTLVGEGPPLQFQIGDQNTTADPSGHGFDVAGVLTLDLPQESAKWDQQKLFLDLVPGAEVRIGYTWK